MRCTNCGTDLIAGKQFCHVCGARAPQACPNCGATVQPGFRFCPDCGFQIGTPGEAPGPSADPPAPRLEPHIPEDLAQKIRATRDVVAGERKLVTVLFCDLAGSTAMAERLDPEEYHDLLEQYVELAFREIYRFEGIVNQMAGDGFMALFGAPIAHEDAPQRAIHAALAIRDALGTFNQRLHAERGLELRARIGVNSGPVVVGTVGNDLKMDYTAIGDTTNLAARLESLAEPGTILVSESTYRLARGAFEMRGVGPFTVKGKSEPVVAYEVVGRGTATTPMGIAEERGLTPFVGRDAEIAQLDACFTRLSEDLAQVVAIVGQAGSGKSRLIYEFKQRLASQPAFFFEARCSAWNQMVPYYPFVTMLRHYFGIDPDEPSKGACDKVSRKVRELPGGLEEIHPILCHMLSVPLEGHHPLPAEDIKRLEFEAVAHLIQAEAARAPVIMLIEDLHWIDDPSREMLEAAVSQMGMKPMMLLISHRPDFQPAWRTHAAFTQLTLRRLSDANVTAIARGLAGGPLPAALERMILTKAEGSPFLTEEITRSLIEEGDLARDDGHTTLTRPVEDIRVPGTVQEVIAARLDRLGAGAKRVVQVAAVFGRQFNRDHLAQLLADENIDVAHELDELERRGVIHRKNLFSNDEYRFGESLTQEVAYEGLLLKQRRQLHERIGLLLAGNLGEANPERTALLAHHFARSDNRERAIDALLDAARKAELVPSWHAAARFYREAWDIAEPGFAKDVSGHLRQSALHAAVGLARMIVIYSIPDSGDGERVIRRARELADTLNDAPSIAGLRTFHGMLMMSGDREKFSEGLALVEEGVAVAQRSGEITTAIGISRGLAWSYLIDGRFTLAQRTIEWIVTELERSGGREQLSDIYLGSRFMQDRVRFFCDDLTGAARGGRETYDLAARAANRTVRSSAATMLAQIHLLRGEYTDAKPWAERSLEIALAVGNVSSIAIVSAITLSAGLELGERVAASRYVELIDQEAASVSDLALSSHIIVSALLAIDEVQRAERFAARVHERIGGRLRELYSAVALADVLFRVGPTRWAEAERLYTQSIALAETLGTRAMLAAARLGAGELAAARGDASTSAAHLRHALVICHDLGLGRYQPRVEQLLADTESGTPAHADADPIPASG